METATNSSTLIVEGGGFKTGFTTGILDAFTVSEFNPFNRYIGISGGSISLSYFLSSQYRLCLRAILLLSKDENFMDFRRTFGKEGYMDIDFLAAVAQEKVKFDLKKALKVANKHKVNFVATNWKNGAAAYLDPTEDSWIESLVASSVLPFVTKGRHKLGGETYFDGGWSDPLPVKWAYKNGAKKILVLRTWPLGVRSVQSWSDYFGSIYYNSAPHLKKAFEKCHQSYNESLEFMEHPPKDLVIEQIAPVKLLKSTTYTYTKKTIMSDYRYGLDLGLRYVAKQKALEV